MSISKLFFTVLLLLHYTIATSFDTAVLTPQHISGLSCSSLDSIVHDIFTNDKLHDPSIKLIADELVTVLKEKDCSTIAKGLNLAGFVQYTNNELVASRQFLLEAELLSRNNPYLKEVYAHNQILLGLTHFSELHYKNAILYFERGEAIFSSIGNQIGVIDALQNIGLAYLEDSKLEEAIIHLQRAKELCLTTTNCTHIGYIYHNLSRAYFKNENTEDALKFVDRADSIWTEKQFHQGLFFSTMFRAEIAQQTGDIKNQIRLLKEAVALSEKHQLNLRKHEPYKQLGNIYESLGQETDANEYFVKALDFGVHMYPEDLTEISDKIVRYYKQRNDDMALQKVYDRLIGFYRKRAEIEKSHSDIIYKIEKNLDKTEDQNNELLSSNNDIKSKLNNQTIVLTFLSIILGLISVLFSVIYSENKKRKTLLEQVESQNLELSHKNAQLATSTRTINSQNKQLEIQNESLKNFAYIASHDLKSPARTIKSFIGLLRKKLDTQIDDSTLSILDIIEKTSHNMYYLVHDILNFSLVENNALSIKPCKIVNVLGEVVSDLSSEINENDVSIEIKDMPTRIQADAHQLKQLFSNLISNAIKYRSPNRECKISILHDESDSLHLFTVKDNGIGIEEDFLDKVFVMFEKRTADKNIVSSGIGLAICKKIVELHKGSISVESIVGAGSKFSFSIAKDLG